MKILDFPTNDGFTFRSIECRHIGAGEILALDGRIEPRGENSWQFVTSRGVYDFSTVDVQDSHQLADRIKQGQYNLAGISSKHQNTFFLHVAFFFRAEHKPALNIVLGEKVKDAILQKGFATLQNLEQDIQRNFVLTNGVTSCYAVTIGNNKPDPSIALPDEKQAENQEADEDPYHNFGRAPEEQKTLVLYGKDYTFRIKLAGEGEESFFYADAIDTRLHHVPPMVLFIGDLTFRDGEKFAAESIKRELDLTRGYLDVWDRYTSIEGDFLLAKARKVGLISIDPKSIGYISGGFTVFPGGLSDEQRKLVTEGDELEISEEIPVYIANEDMSWKEYKDWLDEQASGSQKEQAKRHILKVNRVEKNGSWHLSAKDLDIFPSGTASLSLVGDILQIRRREVARERISNGESANPALGLLIEGKKPGGLPAAQKRETIKPLSAFVREKLFLKLEPRERQKDAISIALNTPDIALIQGPPGTGKTTVITAILERLNELADKRQSNQGRVLITSFQHDAVRNVIGRLRINSLPTPKFGRQGTEDTRQEEEISRWRRDYAERLKTRNPEIQQTTEQKDLFERHLAYLIAPSAANATRFLECAKKLNVNKDLAAEIDRLSAEIAMRENVEENNLLKKIRGIRITKEGFLDDGPERADDLLVTLEGILNPEREDQKQILDVLNEAAVFTGNEVSDVLLKKIAKVRETLIYRCSPRPSYRVAQANPEILAVFERLEPMLRKPQNELGEILYDLLNELENNTENTDQIISSYSFAYAATAQQSEGRDIRRAKKTDKGQHPDYDTVIVDEAARINPGDLMIPMSQARRRIILVGDHRQLPHIYDEEIFESMLNDGSEIKTEVVTRSMFEYIKQKLTDLEKIDHIPRVITLDAQYRMHPVLGDLVNRHFYAPHGEGFESPLGEEFFAQNLSPKPYMWIDMPRALGNERRVGISRQRECEADAIVAKLKSFMATPQGGELSYGVITFYRAQKDLIMRKLRDAGLDDKVRVGSVDAFQGMEFDVIFLSVVRTHGGDAKFDDALLCQDMSALDAEGREKWNEYRENIGQAAYGRLISENLLCVALSRQKKLLIAVGDAAIFHAGRWGTLAEKCVPALREFYELCERGGTVIHGNARGNIPV